MTGEIVGPENKASKSKQVWKRDLAESYSFFYGVRQMLRETLSSPALTLLGSEETYWKHFLGVQANFLHILSTCSSSYVIRKVLG